MRIRQPAVAGRFYTGEPHRLAEEVDRYLAAAPAGHGQPPGIIVPHAGHVYSGPVAAFAYRTLQHARRVVVAGPAHYIPVEGVVATAAQVWRTPLGDIPVDTETIASIEVQITDYPHAPEHSLEVQLPFLQRQLPDGWTLVPLLVGRAEPEEVADILGGFLMDPETVVVLSTDLSHYLPYDDARTRDEATASRIVERDWRHIADQDACGAHPLRGLLLAADEQNLPVELLDLRNSGDTAGPHDRVVGYGAFAVGL